MLNITNELKAKLLAAESAEEVTELLKADGQETPPEVAARLWEEIKKARKQDGKELSLDELEAISGGGSDRDWPTDGCAATVEPLSWCDSNDSCIYWDVRYTHAPYTHTCPKCGAFMYVDFSYLRKYYKCKYCGTEDAF